MIKPCTSLLPRCCCCCIYMLLLSIAFTTTSTTTIQARSPTAVVEPLPLSSAETSTSSSPSSTFDPPLSTGQRFSSFYHNKNNNLAPEKPLRKRVPREEKRLTADDCLTSTTSQSWDLPKQAPVYEDTTIINNNQLHHPHHHHHHHHRRQQRHRPILVPDLQGQWRCEYKVTISVPDARHVIQLNLTTFQTLADMRDFSARNNIALQLQEKNKTTDYATSIININTDTRELTNNITASTTKSQNLNLSTYPATSSANTSDNSRLSPSTSDFPRNISSDDSIADFSELNITAEEANLSSPEQQEEDDKLSPPRSTLSASSSSQLNDSDSSTQYTDDTNGTSVTKKGLKNDGVYDNYVNENSEITRSINNLDITQHANPTDTSGHNGEHSTKRLTKVFERAACKENKLIIRETGGQENSKDHPVVVCLTQEGSGTRAAAIGSPVSTRVYHYQTSIQLTLIWDPHSVSSHLSLGYRMLPLEAIPCSHWCSETQSLCLQKHQLCDGHRDCVDGSDEDSEKCALFTSPEQSQASVHEDDSSHMVIIVVTVSVLVVVLIVPTALMIHFKCRSNQRQQRDSLLQQQQRTHSLSSEMYQSPSSSVQDSSVSSHQYDPRASLLQDQQQQQHQHHHHLQQHEYQQQQQQQEPCLDETLNQRHHHSSQSNRQHSLPTSCLEDEETASNSIHFSSLPERSLLDTHNQQPHHHHHHDLHHHHHHHHQQQQQQQQRQQLTHYIPTDCSPQQTSSREINNGNLRTNRRLEKEFRHQSYPHHIAISRDGEEGYDKYQRTLRSSSNSLLIQQQMFRPPPNKTVHDRSSPPPPYSPKPPGAKSLDSVLPAKHCDSGGSFNTRFFQGGQSCDKRSNSCSSGSRSSHFDSSDKSSCNSRNTRRQQQASSPQSALRCHNNNYRPISIQQGQGQGQTCCPSRLIPSSGDSATNISLVPATVGLAAAPPDYHQVASAFPPSIPPRLSPSSGACVGCINSSSSSSHGSSGVGVNSCGCPLGSNNSASSFGHHHNIAAMAPNVTANVFSNNTGLCCGGCSSVKGEHVVMPHHQQHQQQDVLLQFATAGASTTPTSTMIPTPPFNSSSLASRGVDNYNTLNHQPSSCSSSSLLPLSSKTVCDNNMTHSSCTSSSSPSPPSSNLSKNNVISSPPPYNPTNYPLTSSPSSYPPSHITPPPAYNNTPFIPISPAHPGNAYHHHHLQQQQQHGLPIITPHPPPFSSGFCTNTSSPSSSSTCPTFINTTMPPVSGTNVFVFTKSSPSVCPTPINSVNATPGIATSLPSSVAPTNHPALTNGSSSKEMVSSLPDSSPSSQNPVNSSNASTDGSSVSAVSISQQPPQEHLPTSGNSNTSIYSQQQCNKNISSNSNEQPGSIKPSGDGFSANTLCNNDNTNTALATTSAVESTSSAYDSNQAPISSSSLLPNTTATSFISSSSQLQHHHHHHSHHHQYHPHHAQQQSSHHHLQPHHHHNLSTSSTAQGSVDEAISKMSLSSLPSPSSPFSLSPSSSLDPSPTSPFSPPPLASSPSLSSQSPINKHKDNSISPPPTTSNFIKLRENENNIGNLNVFHHHHPHHHDNNNIHHCCKAVESEHCFDVEIDKQQASDKSSFDGTNLNSKPLDTNGNTATAAFVIPAACGGDANVAGNAASKCDFDGSSNNNIHHHPHNANKTTTTTPSSVVVGLDSESCAGTASIAMAPGYVDNKYNFDKDDKLCDDLPSCTSNDDNCNDVIISPLSSSSTSSCVCE